MSGKHARPNYRRGRAIAVAGLATAATVAGIALATSAHAATNPSVTWDAPAQVVNDGTTSGDGTLTVNNSGTGTAAIGPNVVARLTLSGISTLNCADVQLYGDLDWTALTGSGGNCTEDIPFTQGTTNTDYDEFLSVNQAVTGTLTSTIAIIQQNVSNVDIATLGTSTDTTVVANGSAPTFTSAPVPPAIVYHNYTFPFATSQGFPTVLDANVTYYAFGIHQHSNGTYSCNYNYGQSLEVNGTTHEVIWLSDDFYFDVTTGAIAHDGVTTQTNSVRYWTWEIVENNNEGGLSAGSAAVPCGTTAVPKPTLAVHDVVSPTFTTPVLFSDVSLTAPFATEIYDLSDASNPIINGYADGTFRPTSPVSRQAFAAFLARLLPGIDDGACSTIHGSAFADVADSSPFCKDIRDLAQAHIVNGYTDGLFHPTAPITRQAMAAMLYRAHAYLLGATVGDALCTTPVPFNDVSTSSPFCGDIEWMQSSGLGNGFADGGFHPTANVTRQATAAFVDRFDQQFGI